MFSIDQISTSLQVLATISMLTFVISIICIPLLVARLPRNYFQLPKHNIRGDNRRLTPSYIFILLLRNIAGAFLFLAGIAMLFLPGQGVITIIIAFAMMTLPYKKVVLHKLTRHDSVQKSLDWIRKKMKKESFYW